MTTGSAGLPETPVTGFSSHMILIWENLETPRCCSAILSASAAISQPAHPSYYNALYISSTNASHISSLRGQKTSITIFSNTYELNERQFICSVFSRAPFWHHLCAGFYALIYPGWKNKKKHSFQYKPFFFFLSFAIISKAPLRLDRWWDNLGSWHLDMPECDISIQKLSLKNRSVYQ